MLLSSPRAKGKDDNAGGGGGNAIFETFQTIPCEICIFRKYFLFREVSDCSQAEVERQDRQIIIVGEDAMSITNIRRQRPGTTKTRQNYHDSKSADL